jgi:hypothetical protein
MATPSHALVSLCGDTFETSGIKRVGALTPSDDGASIHYLVYFYDGTCTAVKVNIKGIGIVDNAQTIIETLEAGRQKLILARWPLAQTLVITNAACQEP